MLQTTVTTQHDYVRVYPSMDDPAARHRIAAELVARIERHIALRRLQKAALEWRARKCLK
jgi:hypothetical protein